MTRRDTEKMAPPEEGQVCGSLRLAENNQLQQSNGVIAPPSDVDPGMRKPAPDMNTGGLAVPAPGPSEGVQPK